MWTDSWYRFVDFSVDRLLLLFVDRLFLQIRGLFCGQTFLWTDSYYFLWTDFFYRFVDFSVDRLFCGQTLATFLWTDSYYFLWTDSCYRFVDFSVDRLADLVDRICGQILVINSGQILWTNLCTFVWQIFVTDSIDKNTNLDIEILLTEFVDKFVQPWQTFFRRTCWKEYQRFSFQQGGEICFLWDKL